MKSYSERVNAVALEAVSTNGKEEPKFTEWEQKKIDALTGTNGDPALIHDAHYGLLMDEASKVLKSNRPIRQQRSLIKVIANDLNLNSQMPMSQSYTTLSTPPSLHMNPI
jgi:hypothetical protein